MDSLGDKLVMYRGTNYRPDTVTRNGKGTKAQVAQMFKALAAVPFEPLVAEAALHKAMRATSTYKGMGDAKFAENMQRWMDGVLDLAYDLAPYPETGINRDIPGYGYIRPFDAMFELFYAMEKGQIVAFVADAVTEVREAWQRQKRAGKEEALEKYLNNGWVKDKLAEIVSMDSVILLLKQQRDDLVKELESHAKKEVDPTAQFWGSTIKFMSDADKNESGHTTTRQYKYIAKYPTTWQTTRADCGEETIYGLVTKDSQGRVRCDIRQGKRRKTFYADKGSKAPASNASTKAMKWLVEQHGIEVTDGTVSYNWPKTKFHWERTQIFKGDDDSEEIDGDAVNTTGKGETVAK